MSGGGTVTKDWPPTQPIRIERILRQTPIINRHLPTGWPVDYGNLSATTGWPTPAQ